MKKPAHSLRRRRLIAFYALASCLASLLRRPSEQHVHQMPSREAALAYLKENMTSGDAVLVKASHSMELDRIAKGLLN